MFRVELALGHGEQTIEDLAVLVLGRRLGQAVQPSGGVEIRHAGALDEDLLHVGARQQVGERAQIRDRPQHAMHHRGGVTERNLLTRPRLAFVVLDRALDLGVHFGQLLLRLQPAPFDAGDHIVPNDVVGVGTGHAGERVSRCHFQSARRRRRGIACTISRTPSMARVNRPRPTGRPAHAASDTR